MRVKTTTPTNVGRLAVLAAVLVIAGVGESSAQVFTPTYMAPRGGSELGFYISDGPGDFALEGIWRRGSGSYDLGLRAGLADTEDLTFLVGGELRNPLSVGAPIDLAVTGAAQGAFGDVSGGGFLVGLTIGHTFAVDELAFTPYVHPRAGLVEGFGSDGFDLELLADLGLDVRIGSNLELRFGFGIDSGADWGIGLAWR
jgi:hypothetical protein